MAVRRSPARKQLSRNRSLKVARLTCRRCGLCLASFHTFTHTPPHPRNILERHLYMIYTSVFLQKADSVRKAVRGIWLRRPSRVLACLYAAVCR